MSVDTHFKPIQGDQGKEEASGGKDEVEQRVRERTRELEQTNEASRQSEHHLAAELDTARRLQQVSTQLIQAGGIDALYEQILDTAVALLCADFATVQKFHPERGTGGELRLLGMRGLSPQAAKIWEWVRPASKSTCGEVLRTGERCAVPDLRDCGFLAGTEDLKLYLQNGIRAAQTTPLYSRSGALLGCFSTYWREPHELTVGELHTLDILAREASDLIDRSQAEADLRESEARFRELAVDLETRVTERTARLTESLQSLESVLYHVAHDLRAPLRTMHSFTDVLLEEYAGQLDEHGQDYVRRVADASGKMDLLIGDLLNYGRLGHQAVARVPVNLNALLDRVLLGLEQEVQSKQAEIRVDKPLPRVWGDARLLERVFTNLACNALKFVRPGTTPCLHIWAEPSEFTVRINVQDNGIGIAPEHQTRIFNAFERLHNEESDYPGTGIGLAIVKKGMERLQGRVGVESKPDAGSVFWVELEGLPQN